MNHEDFDRLTSAPDGRPDIDQPRWRQDFPIDWPQDEYVSRRDFTKFMVLTSFAFTVGQFWILAKSLLRRENSAPILEIARLRGVPIGGTVLFNYPGPRRPAVLIRLSENSFVAYDQKCTHLSCPVIPDAQAGRLRCPCHEGVFDLATGRPIAGPPRRPLPRIKLELRNGVIYAAGLEERST